LVIGQGHVELQPKLCPQDWEMRETYIVEANVKPKSWSQKLGADEVIIPKRILYIDSEGWFITASDHTTERASSGRPSRHSTHMAIVRCQTRVAIYPFKRMFQTALVDEDVQDGCSTVVYMPGHETEERQCWYINMSIVTK
jgi:hypothetical protein